MAEDYYKLLGVSRSASQDEIQKSYRKQARKYHPDLHADESDKEKKRVLQQFQKIQQAYDTLSDPKKREMYDQFGSDFDQMGGPGGNPFGGPGGGGGGGGNPFGGPGGIDLSSIFGGGGGGGGGFEDMFRQMGGGGPQPPAKGSDVEQEITVSFAVAVLGGKHQLGISRNGKAEKLDVSIPAGIESGKKIRLRGQGNPGAGGQPGDMLVTVKVAGHPAYARKGLNLLVDVPITILEAVEGAKLDLPTPHGTVVLTVPAGTSSGKTLRLKGMGVKTKDRSGDLLATLQVGVPEEASEQDLEALRQLSDAWSNLESRAKLRW